MRDYARLCKALRFCATHFSCDGCGGDCKTGSNEPRTKAVLNDAADAIEELLAENKAIKQSNKDAAMRNKILCDEISRMKEKVPYWISVEERLPEYGERVLVSNGGFVCESYLSQSGKWQRGGVDMFFMTPTHWCNLPEPRRF